VEWWQAVVLGLVEGITEYLPVSSTGHLILASQLMGLKTEQLKSAIDSFEIVIQGGAILAVVGLYWPRMIQMLKGLLGKDAAGLHLFVTLVIAFIPSAVLGLALKKKIEANLFFATPVLLALVVGGVYMIIVEQWQKDRKRPLVPTEDGAGREKDLTDVSYVEALMIGLLQCVSLMPGTSRSMMTITGGYFAGLAPRKAAEFSFLLGLPTLSAATLYSLYKNLKEAKAAGAPNLFEQLGTTNCIIGIVVAAVSAAIAVKWLVGFLGKHGLTPFGIYRIVLCAVLLALSVQGIIQISK
jgi:undecaprenyl-diphosphatase